jgi:hypothetical protein
MSDARDRELMASALELANSGVPAIADTARSYLEHRAHAQRRARATTLTATPSYPARFCGATDDFGRCIEPYHDMSCASVVSDPVVNATYATAENADTAWESARAGRQAMQTRMAKPFADTTGRTFVDQHGEGVTLTDAIEASAGYVIRRGYGPARPDLCQPQPIAVTHRATDPGGLDGRGTTNEYEPWQAALRQQIDPRRERPSDLAERRELAGHRPGTLARHWGDAYEKTDLEALGRD